MVRACLLLLLAAGCTVPWEPARPGDNACTKCHGDSTRPGDALSQAAPPNNIYGNADPATPGVGAHQLHLNASQTHGAVACAECHLVPERTASPGHDDTAGPAELIFGPLASQGGRSPQYDAPRRRCGDTYCHGPASTSPWNQPRSAAQTCGSCHGLPPPSPHPQSQACESCHDTVAGPGLTIIAPALHVNGTVEVSLPQTCDGCHGSSVNAAPPRDTKGNTLTSAPGVGAHQAHLVGTGFARRPACGECHAVPAAVLSPGHNDGVTQVVFSGVALIGGSTPSYAQGSCGNAWCHDTRPLTGLPSNGGRFQTPSWTRLDGEQVKCDACHGNPPSAPHPQQTNCGSCHSTMDGGAIAVPARHVNGVLDF